MSFTHWDRGWPGISAKKQTPSRPLVCERGGRAFGHPRAIRCSGCAPAEPYPPNRAASKAADLGVVTAMRATNNQAKFGLITEAELL